AALQQHRRLPTRAHRESQSDRGNYPEAHGWLSERADGRRISGVPGFELSNTYTWYVLGKSPAAVVQALNRELVQVLASPELVERFAADASEVAPPYSP